jgi:microcystin-dependent protein
MFAGNFAPVNFQFCQGQTLAISQNTALFSILGTTYGGNGTTTFALPDLRGRVPVGVGTGLGLSPIDLGEQAGVQQVTLNATNLPAHTHASSVVINAAADGRPSSDSPAGNVFDSGSGSNIFGGAPDGSTTMNSGMATATISPAGNNLPFSVQNPYLGINFIIAVQGIFPTRN